MDSDYIKARKSQLFFYNKVPLYKKNDARFVLYKPAGIGLVDMRLNEERHPRDLYISKSDKLAGIFDQWATWTGREGYIARSLGMAQGIGESLSDVAIFHIVRKHGVESAYQS